MDPERRLGVSTVLCKACFFACKKPKQPIVVPIQFVDEVDLPLYMFPLPYIGLLDSGGKEATEGNLTCFIPISECFNRLGLFHAPLRDRFQFTIS